MITMKNTCIKAAALVLMTTTQSFGILLDGFADNGAVNQPVTIPGSPLPLLLRTITTAAHGTTAINAGVLRYTGDTGPATAGAVRYVTANSTQGMDFSSGLYGTLSLRYNLLPELTSNSGVAVNTLRGTITLTDINTSTKTFSTLNLTPTAISGENRYNLNMLSGGTIAPAAGQSNFDMSQIRAINIAYNETPVNEMDFSLDAIEVVPEPFSMLTMGAGVAAFVRTRRKNSSKK